jgi:hypothetical protein
MSDETRNYRRKWIAGGCFAVAICGIAPATYVAFNLGMPLLQGFVFLAFFPTTAIGVGGGIGSLHGQTLRGILVGIGTELAIIMAGTILAIAGLI